MGPVSVKALQCEEGSGGSPEEGGESRKLQRGRGGRTGFKRGLREGHKLEYSSGEERNVRRLQNKSREEEGVASCRRG